MSLPDCALPSLPGGRFTLRLALASVVLAVPSVVIAQQNATAVLSYDVRGFLPALPAPPTPLQLARDDCNGSFSFNASAFGQNAGDGYVPTAPFTGTCDLRTTAGTPLGFGGRAEVFSYAKKPVTFDPANPAGYQLAKLGARAEIVSELRQWDPTTGLAPAGEPATGRWSASSTATFNDFLRVVDPTNPSIQVSQLALEFVLSGSFTIGPFPGAGGFGGASAGFTVLASHSVGNGGEAIYERARSQGGPDLTVGRGEETSVQTSGPILEAGPCQIGSGPGCVRLSIGPAFFNPIGAAALALFDNGIPIPPSLSDIALQLSLTAAVSSADVAYLNLGESSITERVTRADFANTLSFVGVQAFDANGQDITSILRFASLGDPLPPDDGGDDSGDDDGGTGNPPPPVVPEPGSLALLAAGLGGLLTVARRRSHPR